MAVLHNFAFVVIAALNLGIGQIVFPNLPPRITRFSFAIIVLETAAWAYIFYANPWTRSKIFRIAEAATIEK